MIFLDKITLNANAKINLYLDVTGRRDDGYHLLETVMHTVSLHDTVSLVKRSDSITVVCSGGNAPNGEKNIAYKCADAFFRKTGIENAGIGIAIEKKIPSQAGMGGGSADGAAVLKGMNILFDTRMSDDELCELSAPLGADIPFCIKGGCGYCTGIGEIIEPLSRLTGYVLIGKGSEGISTAEAFGKIDASGSSFNLSGIREIFSDVKDLCDIAPYCRNVFDEVTSLGEISNIKKIMTDNGAVCSCMTGSGSAVFGIYKCRSTAENASHILQEMGFFSAVCEFV